jgi:acyl-coenzyme A synthetase/AMP-(fatty) acid ligase
MRLKQELKKNGEIVVYKLQEWAEKAGKKNFFYYGEENKYLTFEEFKKRTNSIANCLQSMGVKKGTESLCF